MKMPKVIFFLYNKKDVVDIMNRKYEVDEVSLIVDGEKIYGSEHLLIAFNHAYRRFINNAMKSSNLTMETLLFAALTMQIELAKKRLDVTERTGIVALLSNIEIGSVEPVKDPYVHLSRDFLHNLGIDENAPVDNAVSEIVERMTLLNLAQ